MSSTSDDDPTPLDGDDFLAANRANRERIRDEESAKAADPSVPEDEAEPPVDGSRNPLVIGLIAAVAVLVVAVGVLGYLLATSSGESDETDSTGAIRDAKRYAAEMFTYETGKYDDLDRRIREIATPEFADHYITSSQLARKANDEAKASSKGVADTAGIVSINSEEAVVLVALNMTVTSPDAPALGEDGTASQSRVEMTLTRSDGRWVVSDLSVV